jgi:phenylacetate-CoA ligase
MHDFRLQSAFSQVVWPAPMTASASSRGAVLFQLEQTQWWSPEALQRAQFEQLKHLVPYAARHVPHYRTALKDFATPEAITPECWVDVPLLSRDLLAPGRMDARSQQIPREHGGVHTDTTSGSTGRTTEFLATDLVAFFAKVFILREHFWHRRDFRQKLMAIRYVKEGAEQAARGVRGDHWGSATEDFVRTGPAILFDLRVGLSELTDRLFEQEPGYLLAHAGALVGIVNECERRGARPRGLRELRSFGEMVPDDLAERSRRILGVPRVDIYSCQEAGTLAMQCPEHPDRLHVQSENVLLEVVDKDNQPVKPGEVGRVLVTHLHNFATPMIRYELGDYARLGGACPCGRGLPVLERVMGRYRNLVRLPNGDTRWPRIGWEDLVKVAPIDQIQLVQHTLHDVEVRLVMPKGRLTDEQTVELTRFIQRNLGHPFNLRFEYVDEIRHAVNGKVEAFISKIASP